MLNIFRIRLIVISLLGTIAIANQALEWFGVYHPVLFSYLDDLLAVPLTLGIFHLLVCILRQDLLFRLPLSIIIVCTIGYVFHFELLLPAISSRYTRDIWDVLMYIIGGLLYFITLNPKVEIKKE